MQDATPPDHAGPLFADDDLADTQEILRPRLEFVSLDLN
jgi:hypothetical protein